MELELRKQLEKEHADKLKALLQQAPDQEKVAPNKKFYSITRGNINYIKRWLLDRIANDKKFLDYCCGEGDISIFLAKNGANVIGVDISDISIKISKEEALKEGLKDNPIFLVMDGENLQFHNNTFDFIFCGGVLHHLNIEKAYKELARVLKPDGEIICDEPLSYNPIFQLYRKLTPSLRTKWEMEHLLNKKSIKLAKEYFDGVEVRFYHLTTLLAVPFRRLSFFNKILSIFEAIDSFLLKLPGIKWLAWQIVFILLKPKGK